MQSIHHKKIAVGLSGGTDSSMAAYRLVARGARVHGLTFRLWNEPSGKSSPEHIERARRVAATLGIPHTVIDLHDVFREHIVDPFVESYFQGRTPSPCVRCNRMIKFGRMFCAAESLGYSLLATGHYARVMPAPSGGVMLLRGRDPEKDQSYFLAGLTAEQLSRTVFPLGELSKVEVKAMAAELGLVPHDVGESQDLCFVPDGDYVAFLERRAGGNRAGSGEIVDEDGRVLGVHHGIHRYTIGQRRGLGLGGGPWYVIRLDVEASRVVVGPREALFGRDVDLGEVNWLGPRPASGERLRVSAQLRYNMAAVPAWVEARSAARAVLTFEEPVYAVTPGQFAVWYKGDRVLGGGWILGAGASPERGGGEKP